MKIVYISTTHFEIMYGFANPSSCSTLKPSLSLHCLVVETTVSLSVADIDSAMGETAPLRRQVRRGALAATPYPKALGEKGLPLPHHIVHDVFYHTCYINVALVSRWGAQHLSVICLCSTETM